LRHGDVRGITPDSDDTPIGLVALSNIARNFQTALLWYVLGDKSYRGQGYTTRAVSEMLTLGFTELALQTVNAWTLESNQPSIKVLTRNHFQLVGRQRRCHRIDGHAFDRLLFDVLRTDHMPK
jgi:RimJ/RimL family protein N-acetyltransferase